MYDYNHRWEEITMNINKHLNGSELTIKLEGKLDSTTAPALEQVITTSLKGITSLIFDFEQLEYLSSAGLRILLVSQKVMDKQGSMIVRHVNEDIMDIFDMTGFVNILTIEK